MKLQPWLYPFNRTSRGRTDISIERVAINIDDFRIKDNEGNQPIDEKIYSDGDNAYFSTLPIKAIQNEITKIISLLQFQIQQELLYVIMFLWS